MLSPKPEDVGIEGWETLGYFWMSGDKSRSFNKATHLLEYF